jgi:hypothetical protein
MGCLRFFCVITPKIEIAGKPEVFAGGNPDASGDAPLAPTD